MQYLLIIGCSQRKVESDEIFLPAIDRYKGPTYQCLRKLKRNGFSLGGRLDCLIISAKYGLIACQYPITDYDKKMTPACADFWKEQVQQNLRAVLESKSGGYDEVFINLGEVYRRTLKGFHWGLISTMEASGGIGLKTQQMKTWLERINEAGAR